MLAATRRQVLAGVLATAAGAARAQTPALHVPPEEAPHEATLMMWPNSRAVYDDAAFLRHTQRTLARLAAAIADFEPVILLATAAHHTAIRRMVPASVTLWDIETEDLWARDAGPLIAFQGARRVVSHIRFDGWGAKQVAQADAQVATRVAERLGLPMVDSGLAGEAGGVEHDGHGLLLAHESSWVESVRNPGLTRAQIESRLLAAYGAQRMIWSPGVQGLDITDYHIDSLARLTGPARALVAMPARPDPEDPFHAAAAETLAALRAGGVQTDVIQEPTRRRVRDPEFVASYVNYYVCNGAVILPEFGDAQADAAAIAALARHFPGREVVTLNTDALGELGGGIHCATQQIPA